MTGTLATQNRCAVEIRQQCRVPPMRRAAALGRRYCQVMLRVHELLFWTGTSSRAHPTSGRGAGCGGRGGAPCRGPRPAPGARCGASSAAGPARAAAHTATLHNHTQWYHLHVPLRGSQRQTNAATASRWTLIQEYGGHAQQLQITTRGTAYAKCNHVFGTYHTSDVDEDCRVKPTCCSVAHAAHESPAQYAGPIHMS